MRGTFFDRFPAIDPFDHAREDPVQKIFSMSVIVPSRPGSYVVCCLALNIYLV